MALNWVRQQSRGVIVPIVGARKLSQIQDNLGCLEFDLTEAHLKRLEEASRVDLGFPLAFLEGVQGGRLWRDVPAHR